jgi:hypothetical protein
MCEKPTGTRFLRLELFIAVVIFDSEPLGAYPFAAFLRLAQ